MFVKCQVFMWQFALLTSQMRLQNATVSSESSEEYLKKVMIELQQMKEQPLGTIVPPPLYLQNNNNNNNNVNFLAGERHLKANSNTLRLSLSSSSSSNQENNVPRDQTANGGLEPIDITGTSNSQYYYDEISSPPGPLVTSTNNNALKFTRNELASIYKQLAATNDDDNTGNIIQGSPLKTLMTGGGQLPRTTTKTTVIGSSNNPIGIGRQPPTYAYYFYPLKSFMGSIRNNNGFSIMQQDDMQTDATNTFHESQKQQQMVINPLFMAISSFLGMAIVFMLGILIMPRLFPDFKSRFAHDELLDLTKTVSDAIGTYNKTITTTTTPIRPKTRRHYPEAIIGIKTIPRNHNTSVKKRTKLPNAYVVSL